MPFVRSLLTGAATAAALTGGAIAALRHPVFGAVPEGDRLERMKRSPQWRDGAFHNALPSFSGGSPASIWEFFFGDKDLRQPDAPIPIVRRTRTDFETHQDLRLTWLGHGTTLVEIEGRRFLIDPLFSRHASPGPMFGVARFHDPPLPLAELPELDAIVLTHDHYDHLDAATVRQLADRIPNWVTPLGVGAHLERWGVAPSHITELDWWERTSVSGIGLVCTPARHFSGRGVTDRNRTLWSGWAFLGTEKRVYATGDGGMQRAFAEVGERFGPFDATLAETGAYNADWADIHMGPEQAVQAVQDAKGGLLIPIHWGTFNLAFHGWTEPAERVWVAAKAAGVELVIPKPGEGVVPESPPPVTRWWPERPWKTAEDAPVVSSGV